MAQLTQATPRNYWISPNALFIQLNAMGTPDYIQASCTSGAQILVYVKDIIPYDAGHNYQRWPLQASPTVFNSHTEKYVYVAVPRSDSSQKEAVVVFPSEEIDIYGKNENAEQIGDEKYYYIFLQGIITSSGDNGTTPRDWKENCRIATGYLSSDEAVSAGPNDSEWFSFSPVDNFTTFLKDLTMKAGTKFRELFAKAVTIVSGGSITFEGQHTSLSGVADETTAAEAVDRIVTPKYMDDHALSSVHDDVANGLITFLQGLQVGSSFISGLLGTGGVFRKDADGKTYIEVDKIYARVKAIFDNVEIRNFQHTSGNRIVSVAGMTIVRVENVDANGNVIGNNDNTGAVTTAYRCYFRGKDGDNLRTNDFVVGDLAFCSRTNVDENLTHKRYWRAVIRKSNEVDINGNHWIDLSVDDCEKDSDIPSVGDDVSQLGNKTKTERQGVIIEMSSGEEAPCYQIFQGINDYTLDKKCMIDLGYNSATGRAKMNVYGDAYIGDVDENTFLRYDSLNKTLEIKAKIDAKSTIGDRDIDKYIKDNTLSSDDVKNLINSSEIIGSLQNQIDGAIETWYYEGEPTLENLPAQGWTDDDTKNKHIGDLYYDKASGKGYRFLKDETGAYIWAIITDEDITKALALAGEKKRIFGRTPTPPYDVDDLWVYAVYPSDGSKYNKEILRCITAKSAGEKFSIDDWALASDYATNTKVAQLDYLRDALKNDTAINGGLILSTLIALRDKSKNIQSGINGAVQDAKYKGGGIAAWYGGEMGDIEDKSNYPGVTNWAKSLLRFDGSGYLANGNISWGSTGNVTIKDLSALINSDKTDVLNVLASISGMFSTTVKGSEVLLIPQKRFGELFINRLRKEDLDNNDVVLTQQEMKDRFVTIDWFNKVFSVVDDKKSDLPVNGNISAGASIHAKMSLYSDGGLSALGNSDVAGGGGGGLMGTIVPYAKAIALTVQNEGEEIASAWSVKMLYDKIENVDVSGQLTSYLTKSEAQSLYQPVGNYLTAHQDISGKADRSELSGYLPLTGGTLSGTLTASKGLIVQGRVYDEGDDEGIIVKMADNGWAGINFGGVYVNHVVLYYHDNKFSVKQCLNNTDTFTYFPIKNGTLALTSQIPTNNNQLTNGAGYITSSGSCAYATTANKLDSSAGSEIQPIYFKDGKPVKTDYSLAVNVKRYFGSLASSGWKLAGGLTRGSIIQISYNNNPAPWNSGIFSSSIVFGTGDVKGLLDCHYRNPIISFGGGQADEPEDSPIWYFKLRGTSECTYTFPTSSTTLAANDGSNATGTWGINITGNAGSANSVAWGNISGKPTTLGGYGITDGIYHEQVGIKQDNITWFEDYAKAHTHSIIYNTQGYEYAYLINMRNDYVYGNILKIGYADTYLRILRKIAGKWLSSDWEKISAGYADSAGTLDGVSNGSLTANYFNCSRLDRDDTLDDIPDGVYAYFNGNNPTNAIGHNAGLLQLRGRFWDRIQLSFPGNSEGRIYYRQSYWDTKTTIKWYDWKPIAFISDIAWSNVSGKPTKLSDFADDIVSGKYLSLQGGTVNGRVRFNGIVSAGEYSDDNYGIYTCTRNHGDNCCYSFVNVGMVAYGIGYDASYKIVLGEPKNGGKAWIGKWLTISSSTTTANSFVANNSIQCNGQGSFNSIQIGNITISYDAANKGLRIAGGGLYTDSYLSSLGVDASTALSVKKWADSINLTEESDGELATAYSIGNLYRLINSNQKSITESLNQSVSALQGRCTSLENRVLALENKVNK